MIITSSANKGLDVMHPATYFTKDQNTHDETTIYWFDVDGKEYGVVESGGDSTIIDFDGCTVNVNDQHNVHLPALLIVTDEMRAE